MEKKSKIVLWGGTSLGLIGAALSGYYMLIGSVAGYWMGFLNIEWLQRDAKKSSDLDFYQALRKMQRSFFTRLGVLTLVAVIVGKWRVELLIYMLIGLVIGMIVFLVLKAKQLIS